MNNFEKAKAEYEKKQRQEVGIKAQNIKVPDPQEKMAKCMQGVMPQLNQPDLTPREAITAFVAWLTTRPTPVTFSAAHNSAKACNLVNQFCDWNKWAKCREDYTKRYKVPGEE